MLIAQFSDMHVKARGELAFGRLDTVACLERCVAHVAAMQPAPDVVLLTGDLTYDGQAAEYATLRAVLDGLPSPYFVIPGNHDDRGRLRAAFADGGVLPANGEFLHYVVDDYPVRLITLDTTEPGLTGGVMCEARLAWLAAQLAEARARPTVIFMHHPPIRTGIAPLDRVGLDGAAGMAAVVRRHDQVVLVVCGHVHRPIQAGWAGTVVATAPGTAHQFLLDLSDEPPAGWLMEPPAVLLHLWDADAGMVTHTSYIGDFGGLQPFQPDGTAY